jgi:nucleoside-diphosphate-sugar epimerase
MFAGVRSCYDEGKRTAETLAMDYHRGELVNVRIARIFNTYAGGYAGGPKATGPVRRQMKRAVARQNPYATAKASKRHPPSFP